MRWGISDWFNKIDGMALKIEFVPKQKAWLYDLTGMLSGEVVLLINMEDEIYFKGGNLMYPVYAGGATRPFQLL